VIPMTRDETKGLQEFLDNAFLAYVDAVEGELRKRPSIEIMVPDLSPQFRRELYELIAILRDETQSEHVHARCMTALKTLGGLP
jgi:hypothetical protein